MAAKLAIMSVLVGWTMQSRRHRIDAFEHEQAEGALRAAADAPVARSAVSPPGRLTWTKFWASVAASAATSLGASLIRAHLGRTSRRITACTTLRLSTIASQGVGCTKDQRIHTQHQPNHPS